MGSVRRPRDGRSWEARYRDAAGRQRSRTFKTKREAEQFLQRTGADIQRGDWVDPRLQRRDFTEWANEWRAGIVHLEPNTVAFYDSMLRNHVLPAFSTMPIGSIDQASHCEGLRSTEGQPVRRREGAASHPAGLRLPYRRRGPQAGGAHPPPIPSPCPVRRLHRAASGRDRRGPGRAARPPTRTGRRLRGAQGRQRPTRVRPDEEPRATHRAHATIPLRRAGRALGAAAAWSR